LCQRLRRTDEAFAEIALLQLPIRLAKAMLRLLDQQTNSVSAKGAKIHFISPYGLLFVGGGTTSVKGYWIQYNNPGTFLAWATADITYKEFYIVQVDVGEWETRTRFITQTVFDTALVTVNPRDYCQRSRPHRRCWLARPDLSWRWPSRLVATAAKDRLNFRRKSAHAVCGS
jgi:hypothetical protein